MSGSTTRRSLTYWLFFLLFLVGGGPIMGTEGTIMPSMHILLDGVAVAGAGIAAILVYRAYRETRANVLAFVCIALTGVSVFELVHATSGSNLLGEWIYSDASLFMPWSWNASQLFLALVLLSATPFIKKENYGEPATVKQHPLHTPKQIALFCVVLVPVVLYGLFQFDLPAMYDPSRTPQRLPEAFAGVVFLAALLVFVRKGNWRTDSYGHWLNVALIASLCSQIFCMTFSRELFDSSFTAAHILKIVSYGCLVYGFASTHRVSISAAEAVVSRPKGLGLGVKVAILCGFIGFICVMPIAYKSSQTLHQIAAENGIDNLSAAASSATRALNDRRVQVDGSLRNYAGSMSLEEFSYGQVDEQHASELADLANNVLNSDSSYIGIAFVDAITGETILRSERNSGADFNLTDRLALEGSELRLAALAMSGENLNSVQRAEIFLLQGDGSKENYSQVEGAALAVTSNKTGKLIGAFVLHTDVTDVLDVPDVTSFAANIYVVNSAGQFLQHPDSIRELSPSEEPAYTFDQEFPGLDIAALTRDGFATGTAYVNKNEVELYVAADRQTRAAVSGEQILFIFSARKDVVEKNAALIGYEMQRIAQFNLLVAILVGWFFARRFAKPVQEVSAAAVEFGRSGTVTALSAPGRDEIGMLSKSLTDMMNEVTNQRDKLLLLAAAVESSVDSIIITTTHGVVEYVNPHYEKYSGLSAEEVIGKNIMEMREFIENRHILSESPSQKGDEQVWIGELQTRRADGKNHVELVTISPIRNSEGEMKNQSLVIEDITERRALEQSIERNGEELQRSNHDLEQFAYVASHDLKAPLRAIEVLVGWLKDDLEEYQEGDVHENLDLLQSRTRRLSRLLDDLLAYSRAGRKIGGIKEVDIKEFVDDIAILIAPPEGFVIETVGNLPTIVTHHAPLETVFRNLMSNAIKHSPVPEEGRIRIYAEDRGDMVEFAVEDNGVGIPQEYADKVFKMFQTLKARDEIEGSGMGLAIVQRIIDWQGGKIWFHDGPDGKGAVFKFTWSKTPIEMPVIEADDTAQQAEAEATVAAHTDGEVAGPAATTSVDTASQAAAETE
jgi:PAS domain S-box-containing protein